MTRFYQQLKVSSSGRSVAGIVVLLLLPAVLPLGLGAQVAGESPDQAPVTTIDLEPEILPDTAVAATSATGKALPADTAELAVAEPETGSPDLDPVPETLPTGTGDSPSDPESGEEVYPTLTPEEYSFAGAPRYTLLGPLPFRDTHLRPIPAAATATGVAGIVAAIHFYQQDAWWANRREGFHFSTDWGYAAQADKVGHFYAGYLASYVGYEMLIASGFTRGTAGWLGPLLAVGFQSYVEIEDGFSPFGFDPTDQYANILGPLFFSLRNYIEPLQYAAFKWSYFPNDDYLTGDHYGHKKIIIDDYNGQQIWFSLKVGKILPESVPWPDWLRLAAGYGAYNVDRWDSNGVLQVPGRRFFISLDYDLVELVPDIGSFGNWMVQTLDNFHWPAPALQLAPEVVFYLAWPVRF